MNRVSRKPPYNLNKDYGNSSIGSLLTDNFTQKWMKEACRVLKSTGTIYVFMGFRFISYLYNILEQENKLRFNNGYVGFILKGLERKKVFHLVMMIS